MPRNPDVMDVPPDAVLTEQIVELERLHPEIANTKPPKRPHEF